MDLFFSIVLILMQSAVLVDEFSFQHKFYAFVLFMMQPGFEPGLHMQYQSATREAEVLADTAGNKCISSLLCSTRYNVIESCTLVLRILFFGLIYQ